MALTDNLIAYYTLDSTANDSTANANNGTLIGSPSYATGKINNGISLNGSSQYVTVSDAASFNVAAMSQFAWVNYNAFGGAYNTAIIKGDSTNYEQLIVKSNGKLAVYIQTSAGPTKNYDGTGSHTLTTGTWYHIGWTYDSTSGLIGYVNGASDATVSAGVALTAISGTTLKIGADPSNSRYSNAIIDEVGIWGRALTSTEVSQLYNSGAGLAYPFTGGGGATQSLFRPSLLNGIGSGGPFFNNPIGRSMLGWRPKLVTV